MFIYSYNFNSESAKGLSHFLDAKRIKVEGSKFRGNANKTVINWGSSSLPVEVMKCLVINPPNLVKEASNKLTCFSNMLKIGVSIPPFTTDKEEAISWIRNGDTAVARTILNGHSGKGIVLIDDEADMIEAPLYTKYIKKKDEYRIHCSKDGVFDIQKKARKIEIGEVNWRIRNHANGFIYKRNDVDPDDKVVQCAIDSINSIGLDFGAVDVIWNSKEEMAYVLEINTAPGLEGTTLEKYTEFFKKFM